MDIRKVKKLIELLEESGFAEIEIKEGEETVRISRHPPGAIRRILHPTLRGAARRGAARGGAAPRRSRRARRRDRLACACAGQSSDCADGRHLLRRARAGRQGRSSRSAAR